METRSPNDARSVLERRLRKQERSCRYLGSELYARLLAHAADDVAAGGPTGRVMEPLAFAPPGAAVALRLMGAVHRLVLEGKAPALARFYPSARGDLGPEGAWPAFRALLEERPAEVGALIERPVQTNEVGRCAGLLCGFLEVAARTGLPLRILEIGASAGLNLNWDRYRYAHGDDGWGPEDSPVFLDDFEKAPDLGTRVTVAERLGCDPDPIDATSEEGRLTLASYVWPDQGQRRARLEAALEVAGRHPVNVEKSGAAAWLERALADVRPGEATIVYHSIVMQYLEGSERAGAIESIRRAGAAAVKEAPVAWLEFEPPEGDGDLAEVHLTLWPGGRRRLVARSGYHGVPVIPQG